MNNVQITVKDNSSKVKKELEVKIKKALEQIGQTGESYAKLLCPVDTGHLRNSIAHQVQDKTVYVGTPVEYGVYVELGARGRTPQPFIKPAIKGHLGEYRLIIQTELKD